LFLALAFDLDRHLELFCLRRLGGLRSCKASVRPLPAQHHLENAYGASCTNHFFANYADGRQMCVPIVTSRAESGVSCDALIEAHKRLRHKERWDTFLAAL
jgi:hypothetical protein